MTDLPATIPRDASGLVELWLARLAPGTLDAYRTELDAFARFAGAPTAAAALQRLFKGGESEAMRTVLAYEAELLSRPRPDGRRGLAARTINRRLSALRSVVRLGKRLGFCAFVLDVPCRQVSREGEVGRLNADGCRKILDHLAARTDELARRDLALVRLLWDASLRREEAVGLDLADVELARGVVRLVDAKTSQHQIVEMPISDEAIAAIGAWLAVRGNESGPLFFPLDRHSRARGQLQRLSIRGVNKVIRRLALEAGVGNVRPHDFRRGSVTRLLDLTGGDLRLAMEQGRWASPDTAIRYDQRRRKSGRKLPNMLAADLPTRRPAEPDPEAEP